MKSPAAETAAPNPPFDPEKELDRFLARRAMNEEQAIRAARLLTEGSPAQEVADAFGVSVSTIYATLRRYGLPSPAVLNPSLRAQRLRASLAARTNPPPKLTREKTLEAMLLIESTRSLEETARALGVKPAMLQRAFKRHRLNPPLPHGRRGHPRSKLTEQDAAEIANHLAQGRSLAAIAREYRAAESTIRDLLKRYPPLPHPNAPTDADGP